MPCPNCVCPLCRKPFEPTPKARALAERVRQIAATATRPTERTDR